MSRQIEVMVTLDIDARKTGPVTLDLDEYLAWYREGFGGTRAQATEEQALADSETLAEFFESSDEEQERTSSEVLESRGDFEWHHTTVHTVHVPQEDFS